jgi:amino acid transporter
MFERFKRNSHNDEHATDERGGVATATRRDTNGDGLRDSDRDGVADRDERTAVRDRSAERDRPMAAAPTRRETVRDVRARQRAEYGGIKWGAAFFGWLVAVGMAAILLGLLSAAGTAFGLTDVSDAEARANADTIGFVGGVLLVAVLAIAYFFGGYVSGRMSRFDGGRQGLGTWAIGVAVTIVLAVAGAIFGAEYNVLDALGLPNIPIDRGTLTAGAAVALAAVLVLSLLTAMAGGKAGERYHRKIDRFGYSD